MYNKVVTAQVGVWSCVVVRILTWLIVMFESCARYSILFGTLYSCRWCCHKRPLPARISFVASSCFGLSHKWVFSTELTYSMVIRWLFSLGFSSSWLTLLTGFLVELRLSSRIQRSSCFLHCEFLDVSLSVAASNIVCFHSVFFCCMQCISIYPRRCGLHRCPFSSATPWFPSLWSVRGIQVCLSLSETRFPERGFQHIFIWFFPNTLTPLSQPLYCVHRWLRNKYMWITTEGLRLCEFF